MKRRAIRAALLLLAPALAAPAVAGDSALVIGVGDYPRLGFEARLLGPPVDAARMAEALRAQGFAEDAVTVLDTAPETTRAAILSALEALAGRTGPGDRVVVHFSGHGIRIPDTDGDESDGQDEALAPSDTLVTDEGVENLITDDTLAAWLAGLPDRHVTLVFDTCHSGTASRSLSRRGDVRVRRLPAPRILATPNPSPTTTPPADMVDEAAPHVALWAAAAPHEFAMETAAGGVFTNAFLSGLSGAADHDGDGTVTGQEMLAHTRREAADFCLGGGGTCYPGGMTPNLYAPPEAHCAPVFGPGGPDGIPDAGPGGGTLSVRRSARDEITFILSHPRGGAVALFDRSECGPQRQIYPHPREDRPLPAGRRAAYPYPTSGLTFKALPCRGEFVAVVRHGPGAAAPGALATSAGLCAPAADVSVMRAGYDFTGE